MTIVLALLGAIAFAAWGSAFVHMLLLVPHRRPDISTFRLMFSGYLFYSRDNFQPSGHGHHRRFMISVFTFFGCLVALMIASTLGRR